MKLYIYSIKIMPVDLKNCFSIEDSKFFNQQFPVLKSINNHFYVHMYCKKLLEYDIGNINLKYNNCWWFHKLILLLTAYLSLFITNSIPTIFPALADLVEPKIKKIEQLRLMGCDTYMVYELLKNRDRPYLSDEVFYEFANTFDTSSCGLNQSRCIFNFNWAKTYSPQFIYKIFTSNQSSDIS
jgi:hypothetical protein